MQPGQRDAICCWVACCSLSCARSYSASSELSSSGGGGGGFTVSTLPHLGHFAFFPTALAGALSFLPHEQSTLIVDADASAKGASLGPEMRRHLIEKGAAILKRPPREC